MMLQQGMARVLALVLSLAALAQATAPPAAIRLPAPLGPHTTLGTITVTLNDKAREEIFKPGTHRKLVIQAFYPISAPPPGQTTTAYSTKLSENVLETLYNMPNGTIARLRTNSYAQETPMPKGRKLVPLLFSPGMGMPRFVYTTLCEELASRGYAVIAVDHPYDAAVVEFTDGSPPAYQAIPHNATVADVPAIVQALLDVRVADLRFVARHLATTPHAADLLDMSKLIVFGHSLGGASAAGLVASPPSPPRSPSWSPPAKAGVNLDGMLLGPLNSTSLGRDRPFLILGRPDHSSASSPPELSWRSFKEAQRGWVREITLAGFQHQAYSDEPTVVQLLGLQKFFPPGALEQTIGTVAPARGRRLVAAYVSDFFDWAVRGQPGALMRGPSPLYPEAVFVK